MLKPKAKSKYDDSEVYDPDEDEEEEDTEDNEDLEEEEIKPQQKKPVKQNNSELSINKQEIIGAIKENLSRTLILLNYLE